MSRRILYICTHNRCRSILSEAITNHLSQGRLRAISAGSQPTDQVHPLSLKYLQQQGIQTEGLYSKGWDVFENEEPDVVVTVCDSAASEACPVWFGNTIKVHWGLADPSRLQATEEEIETAFLRTIEIIRQRVDRLLKLDWDHLSRADLQSQLSRLTGE